jgi:predicted nuclease of predicted toxin-antitoxin system
LGLRDASDPYIFLKAREADVVVMTKDKDFVDLLHKGEQLVEITG